MDDPGRRKFERENSHNLAEYVVLTQQGDPLHRYMGRTFNVSEGGILLETHKPIVQDKDVIVTIALDEEMLELRGRVKHVKQLEGSVFHAGIEFLKVDEREKKVLQWYITALKHNQHTWKSAS